MQIDQFKKQFHSGLAIDILIEKRQSLVQQIVDIESEIAHDSQYWSLTEISEKTKGYQIIKAKWAYLDSLIQEMQKITEQAIFPPFMQPNEVKDYLHD